MRARSRRYLVEEVTPPPSPGDETLVRLSCLEDDAEGEELEVLWEKEVDAQRIDAADWSRLAGGQFDDPRHFGAYYHTLRWNAVTSTDPQLFQSPYRAGIRIDAYQLEPLRKALLLPRVNLFIADDVGLGKTIEAGLIVRELLMRGRVRRIVVAAPPSVTLSGVARRRRGAPASGTPVRPAPPQPLPLAGLRAQRPQPRLRGVVGRPRRSRPADWPALALW